MEVEYYLLTVFILHQTTGLYFKDWTTPKITWKTVLISAGSHLILVSFEELIFRYSLKSILNEYEIPQYYNYLLFGLLHIFNFISIGTFRLALINAFFCIFLGYYLQQANHLFYGILLHYCYNMLSLILVSIIEKFKSQKVTPAMIHECRRNEIYIPYRRKSCSDIQDKTIKLNGLFQKNKLPSNLIQSFIRYDQLESKRYKLF